MSRDDDPTNMLAAGAAFLAVCPLIVALRFFVRVNLLKGRPGIEDWLTLPALLMVIGCSLDLIIGVKLEVLAFRTPLPSNRQDPDDSRSYNFTTVEQLEWAFFLMQILSMGFTKLSFVFFYRSIFITGNLKSRFAVISLGLLILLVLWATAFFLWFLLSCGSDFAARWTSIRTLHTVCTTDIKSDLALAISDFLTDVMIVALPIPMVLKLHMSTSRKVAVIAVFALGSVAMVASIIRLAIFVNVTAIASGAIKDPGADNNLLTTRSLYWSMLESGLALIACCLPMLNALGRLPLLQSTMRSIRSLTLLGSSSSRTQDSNKRTDVNTFNRLRGEGDLATDSQVAFAQDRNVPAQFETFAMVDRPEIAHEGRDKASDAIWVDKTFERRDNIV